MIKTVARLDHEMKPFCPTRVFPSLERAIAQLDPFQRYARHVGSARSWCAHLELGAAPGYIGLQGADFVQYEMPLPVL